MLHSMLYIQGFSNVSLCFIIKLIYQHYSTQLIMYIKPRAGFELYNMETLQLMSKLVIMVTSYCDKVNLKMNTSIYTHAHRHANTRAQTRQHTLTVTQTHAHSHANTHPRAHTRQRTLTVTQPHAQSRQYTPQALMQLSTYYILWFYNKIILYSDLFGRCMIYNDII